LLTIHDLHPAVFPEEWQSQPRMLYNFWNVFRHFAQRADAIITHSNFQKEAIVKYFQIPPREISVTYLPLPMNELLEKRYSDKVNEHNLLELGISKQYVLCPMSQVAIHKNHQRTIEAWTVVKEKLQDRAPQLVFTEKGRTEQQRHFQHEIERHGLSGMVVFTGKVNWETMAILYGNCKAVLSPTLYEGGSGYPVLEAVLAGKAVLCSRIPSIEEHVSRFGLTVSYFDPMKPDDIARAVVDFVLGEALAVHNDSRNIRQRMHLEQEAFTQQYVEKFIQLTDCTR